MKTCELTIMIDGKVGSKVKSSVEKSVQEMVKVAKGKVKKLDDWGKKEVVGKKGEAQTGIYLHFVLELSPDQIKKLSSELKLNQDIKKYLLVEATK